MCIDSILHTALQVLYHIELVDLSFYDQQRRETFCEALSDCGDEMIAKFSS